MNAEVKDLAGARLLRDWLDREPGLIDDADTLESRLDMSPASPTDASFNAVLETIARGGIAAQMKHLPADLPVEFPTSTWLADLRSVHPQADLSELREALAAWAFALRCDVQAALARLVREDRSLAFDSGRCRAALLDACPDRPLQVNLLAGAIDADITVEIEKLPADDARAPLLTTLESRLDDEHLRDGTASWTLDAWRAALGHAIEPPAPDQPAELPWSMTTEVLACLAAGMLLMTRLFWHLWGIDGEHRFWFGIESAPWAIGSAIVIGGGIGFFGGLLYSTAALFEFPTRRSNLSAVCRIGCMSTVSAAALAGVLFAVEQALLTRWNLPVATLVGAGAGLVALRLFGKGTSLLLVLATILTWAIYWFHWLIYWEYDPESVCLVSNAPGVDAFFLLLVAAAGAGPLAWTGYRDWAAWKNRPENRFRRWPESVRAAELQQPSEDTNSVALESAGVVSGEEHVGPGNQQRVLTPLAKPASSAADFKPVDGRWKNWLERVARQHPRGAAMAGGLLLIVGVTALFREFGSMVAAAGLISVQWLSRGSFQPLLKPHGDFTNELRTLWFESLDHGAEVGTAVGFTAAALIGLRLVVGDRWSLALTLQDAQRGTLAAAKWLLPFLAAVTGPLVVMKSTGWFQCLQAMIWSGGPCALFLLLVGWTCGGCYGAARSSFRRTVTRGGRANFNDLCELSLRQPPEAGVDGLLGLAGLASIMAVFMVVGGATLFPVMELAMANLARMDSGGTASGRGRLTIIDDGPPVAIPIETISLEFRDDRERAAAEYVGYEFVFTGALRRQAPYFTLSSASGDSARELALCLLTPNNEMRARRNDYLRELYSGRRVIVVGTCGGIDDQGVVRFSDCSLLNWTFDEPQPSSSTKSATGPAGSVGGQRVRD